MMSNSSMVITAAPAHITMRLVNLTEFFPARFFLDEILRDFRRAIPVAIMAYVAKPFK